AGALCIILSPASFGSPGSTGSGVVPGSFQRLWSELEQRYGEVHALNRYGLKYRIDPRSNELRIAQALQEKVLPLLDQLHSLATGRPEALHRVEGFRHKVEAIQQILRHDYVAAERHVDQAIHHQRRVSRVGTSDALAACYNLRAYLHFVRGDPAAALAPARLAYALADRLRPVLGHNVARLHIDLGRYREAYGLYQTVASEARLRGLEAFEFIAVTNLALLGQEPVVRLGEHPTVLKAQSPDALRRRSPLRVPPTPYVDPGKETAVALGSVFARPGQAVAVPVWRRGRALLRVAYSQDHLLFLGAEGAEVSATSGSVRVDAGPGSPLLLRFRVREDAGAGSYPLSAEIDQGQDAESGSAIAGYVRVLTDEMLPSLSCFFFIH
ncbi:MAG: hypothetical protein HY652_04030, partial [Acidobacteria bacterium]|nr:hypothetical protein [Acidobacteriota bacterium]